MELSCSARLNSSHQSRRSLNRLLRPKSSPWVLVHSGPAARATVFLPAALQRIPFLCAAFVQVGDGRDVHVGTASDADAGPPTTARSAVSSVLGWQFRVPGSSR